MGLAGPILEISGLAYEGLVERYLGCRTISVCDRKGGGTGEAGWGQSARVRSEHFSGFVDPVPEIIGAVFGVANGQDDGGIVPGEIGYKVRLERWGQIDSPDPKFPFMEESWRLSDQSQVVIHPGIKLVSKGRIDLEEEFGQLQ